MDETPLTPLTRLQAYLMFYDLLQPVLLLRDCIRLFDEGLNNPNRNPPVTLADLANLAKQIPIEADKAVRITQMAKSAFFRDIVWESDLYEQTAKAIGDMTIAQKEEIRLLLFDMRGPLAVLLHGLTFLDERLKSLDPEQQRLFKQESELMPMLLETNRRLVQYMQAMDKAAREEPPK